MQPSVRAVALACVVSGLALTGCGGKGSSQSPAGATSAKSSDANSDTRFPVTYEQWAPLGYRLDWVAFPFPGQPGRPVVSMQAYDDLVVLQNDASVVTAVSTATGENRWSSELTGPLTKWVGIARESGDDQRLLVASESEAFVLAPATGTLLGRESFARVVNTPPLMVGPYALFGTSTGVVQAHMIGRAIPAWAFASRGAIDRRLRMVGDTVAAVSQGGDVMFFSPDGALVGRGRVYGGVEAETATDGQRLFVASRDQSLWAFDTSGATLWRHRTSRPLTQDLAFHDGTLYADLGEEGLSALDPANGNVRWSNPRVHGRVIGVRAGLPVVWSDGAVMTIEPARGQVVQQAPTTGVTKVIADKFEDGDLYAVSSNGRLAKFAPR